MGELGRSALAHGGEVIGVMPGFLREREIQLEGLTKLLVTETLTERKLLMTQMADAIAALPGGFGTLDELTEILSWRNLHIIHKPIVIINTAQFWDPFLALVDHAIDTNFSSPGLKASFKVVKRAADVFSAINFRH